MRALRARWVSWAVSEVCCVVCVRCIALHDGLLLCKALLALIHCRYTHTHINVVPLCHREDIMPNELLVQHRNVIWDQVFKLEYLPWAAQFGSSSPFKDVASWRRVSQSALIEMSKEEFGTDEDGNPKHTLRMAARANHSNFAECKVCAAGRRREIEAIKNREPREVRERARADRAHHRNEWRTERSLMGLSQKRVSESHCGCWILDDKLGGQWIYQPIPSGNREEKGNMSHWKYRCTLQGVTLTGRRHLFSIVPPNLHTGNNFGVTSFIAGMFAICRQKMFAPTLIE